MNQSNLSIRVATVLLGIAILSACKPKTTSESIPEDQGAAHESLRVQSAPPSVMFSFAFVGCNRVNYTEQNNAAATNGSTANLSALQRIFTHVSELEQKPNLFFFLGDLVLGESNVRELDMQLGAWVKQYNDQAFSKISTLGIELVAVPGNHEMLYYKQYPNDPSHDEWPLVGATDIWMKHMAPYMPKDRTTVPTDTAVNPMTFSFKRGNVGFVVMNTDTYNAPTKENPYGIEGQVPTQWIIDQVKAFRADSTVEHIFVLGHKPYYVDGQANVGHAGLPEGPQIWPVLQNEHAVAMLSAHVHAYQRTQPGDQGTYQVIAGNGGSPLSGGDFFGYTLINIWTDGRVELKSYGFDQGNPYYAPAPTSPMTLRDSTILTWTKNANPYGGL